MSISFGQTGRRSVRDLTRPDKFKTRPDKFKNENLDEGNYFKTNIPHGGIEDVLYSSVKPIIKMSSVDLE